MQSRVELTNIACMTSTEVMGLICTFEKASLQTPRPKQYTYKVPRTLGETLKPGELVLAEYEGTQASNRDRPMVPVIVHEVVDAFDPEDMTMPYKWVFSRVDGAALRELRSWEKAMTDALVTAQRKKARNAVLREVMANWAITSVAPRSRPWPMRPMHRSRMQG